MHELERRIGLLRLLLADITARERQAQEASDQLSTQLARIADFTVRFNTSVANGLAAMDEVEESVEQQRRTARHLELLRKRAQSELDALLVTRSVGDARKRLALLESRRAELLHRSVASSPADAEPIAPVAGSLELPPESPVEVIPESASPSTSPHDGELREIEAEIAELRTAIEAASDAAARSLTNTTPDQSQRHRPPTGS